MSAPDFPVGAGFELTDRLAVALDDVGGVAAVLQDAADHDEGGLGVEAQRYLARQLARHLDDARVAHERLQNITRSREGR